MKQVRMNDFQSEPEDLLRAELTACERVIRSGWWILGSEVAAFEKEWQDWLGVPHAVSCANGLDAIELGLRALNIGSGDEVITTPMTAFATVLAILRAGAIPVLADIDPHTAMLDLASVRRCINGRTKAVLVVHLYGQAAPMEELTSLAHEHQLHLIEDCAQAHGARWAGRSVGTFGSFASWSFYPTKNLGAIGDGGALTTGDGRLAEKVRSLRNYGQTVRYQHPMVGMNSRLDELQAAILRERLKYLEAWISRRRSVAKRYVQRITNTQVRVLPVPADMSQHSYHLFVVTTEKRDDLLLHLQANGVDALIHYPIPVHQQPPCVELRRDPLGLSNAEKHAACCLSIPCHPGLTDEAVDHVVAAVNDFQA